MSGFMSGYLMIILVLLTIFMLLCLIRAILGPRFTDRIVAANMISTLTVVFIVILSIYMHESYVLDIAIVYALLGFLAVVVLSRVAAFRHWGQIINRRKARREQK